MLFDTGSGVSIISRTLARKLKLPIKQQEGLDVVSLGGNRNTTTGMIENAPLIILDAKMPIERLRVVDVTEEIILLGNDWLKKYTAIIDYSKERVGFTAQGRKIELSVTMVPVRLHYHLAGQYTRKPYEAEANILGIASNSYAELNRARPDAFASKRSRAVLIPEEEVENFAMLPTIIEEPED